MKRSSEEKGEPVDEEVKRRESLWMKWREGRASEDRCGRVETV